MSSGMVFYAKQNATYVLKFSGDVRYTLGSSLDHFLDRLFEQDDFDDIVLDLTETTAIDSTNLGLLAKVANFMRSRHGKKVPLFSTDEDVNEILDSVGFDRIFDICQAPTDTEACRQMPVADPSEQELARTVYEAHKCLCELNEKNRQMFTSVVEAMKGEL